MNISLKNFVQVSILLILVSGVISLDASTPNSHHLSRRQNKDQVKDQTKKTQQQVQEIKDGKGGAAQGGTPTEKAANQMMQMLMQIGQSLDAVTSLGSTPETVKSTAEAIIKMVPDVGKATKSLIDTMPNKAQLEGVADKATQSAEQLGKVLKTIEQSPEDANFIKKHYKALGDAFTGIFGAVDPVFSSAFPDDKNGGQQQAGKTDGRQLNTQTEGAQKDQKDTKEKNKKKT